MSTAEAALQMKADAEAFFRDNSRPANVIDLPPYWGLHIGAPKSGKTHTLGTLPGRVCVLDCKDGGTGTAPLVEHQDRITVVSVPDWPSAVHMVRYFASEKRPFDSVAIDGLSRLQAVLLDLIVETAPPNSKGVKPTQMELQLWGVALKKMTAFVQNWQAAKERHGYNIAMSVWEGTISETEDRAGEVVPDLQGRIKFEIGGMFDVVCYHHARVDKETEADPIYSALTVPYGNRIHAGCRWRKQTEDGGRAPVLSPVEVNPNLADWVERIHAGVMELAGAQNVTVRQAALADQELLPAVPPPPVAAKPVAAPEPVAARSTAAPAQESAKPPIAQGNAEAAAAMAALVEENNVLPPKDELIGHLRTWLKGVAPDRVQAAQTWLRNEVQKRGAAKLPDLSQEQVAEIVEAADAFV